MFIVFLFVIKSVYLEKSVYNCYTCRSIRKYIGNLSSDRFYKKSAKKKKKIIILFQSSLIIM